MASLAVLNSVSSTVAFMSFCSYKRNFFFFKVRLDKAASVNWLVKLIVQEAPKVIMTLKQYHDHSRPVILYTGE